MDSLCVMLDDGCVSHCGMSGAGPCRGGRCQLPAETLKRVARYAKSHDIELILLASQDTAIDGTLADTMDGARFRWVIPSGAASTPEGSLMVLDLADVPRVTEVPPIVILTYGFAERHRLRPYINRLVTYGVQRVILVLGDAASLTENDVAPYQDTLTTLAELWFRLFESNRTVEIDVLTDRLTLRRMSNCGAGESHLTIGPDGCVYACPLFFWAQGRAFDCADPQDFCYGKFDEAHGFSSDKNLHLLSFAHAPLCQACDAFHCRRCAYMSWLKTLEPCVPSRIQCLVAHAEREVTRRIADALTGRGLLDPDAVVPIRELKHADPFDYCMKRGFPIPGAALDTIYKDSEDLDQRVRVLEERYGQLSMRLGKDAAEECRNHC